MNVYRALLITFGAACAVAIGCSAKTTVISENSPGGASVADFCAAYCKKLSTCDNARDQQTCTNSCSNQFAATLPKIRSDAVSLIKACLENKDCNTTLKSDSIGVCASEASASIAPSDAATQFCNNYIATQAKCGATKDKAVCLTQAKLYTDATIGDANACTSKACTDIDPCVSATFGGVSSTRVDGPKASETCSSSSTSCAGHTVRMCTTSSNGTCVSARYTVDSQSYACASCTNCTAAGQAVASACSSSGSSSSSSSSSSSGSTSSSSSSGSTGGPTCTISITTNNATCDACLQSSCCSVVNACFNVSDCAALDSCVGGCVLPDGGTNQSCVSSCFAAHPNSQAALQAVYQCIGNSCSTSCN